MRITVRSFSEISWMIAFPTAGVQLAPKDWRSLPVKSMAISFAVAHRKVPAQYTSRPRRIMKRLPKASEHGPVKSVKKANPAKYKAKVIAIHEGEIVRAFPIAGIAGR